MPSYKLITAPQLDPTQDLGTPGWPGVGRCAPDAPPLGLVLGATGLSREEGKKVAGQARQLLWYLGLPLPPTRSLILC